MVALLWIVVGFGMLFLWLKGHWFGWVIAFVFVFFAAQIILTEKSETGGVVLARALVALLCTGVPCFVWGSLSQIRKQ